jgi:hypothetical protein
MNFLGKVLNISLTTHPLACPFVFVCTAHKGDRIEVVPAAPGAEGMLYSPMRISDIDGDGVLIHGWADDPALIVDLKDRCNMMIRILSSDKDTGSTGTLAIHSRAILRNARENLRRIESLSGNLPVPMDDPEPIFSESIALDTLIDDPMTIEDYVGQIVFVEIPIDYDANNESGEYLITAQGADSLYGVRIHGDDVSLNRIPFENDGMHISILYSVRDTGIIDDMIEKANLASWDDDKEVAASAETLGRQLRLIKDAPQNCYGKCARPVLDGVDEVFAEIGSGVGVEF